MVIAMSLASSGLVNRSSDDWLGDVARPQVQLLPGAGTIFGLMKHEYHKQLLSDMEARIVNLRDSL